MKRLFPFIFLGLFCIPALLGLLHPGFFVSDDGNWMVIRFAAFYNALRHGQFPVRFLPQLNNGYGYPVADFLYPLFLYMGVPIHIVGISFVNTIKVIFGASLLFSGLFCYLWLQKIFKTTGALLGALVYVFAPYHLFDVYQRGSIGEVLALAIVPFILWEIERKQFLLVGIGISLLILSHNSLAVLFLPLVIGYIVVRKAFSIKKLVLTVVLGLGLCAFFWMPALFDKQYTVFDSISVSSFTSYFLSLQTFYLFGWSSLLVLILTIPFFVVQTKLPFLFFWFVTLISLLFALSLSSPLWTIFHIVPFFQFPYRFLSVTILGVSFLSAFELEFVPRKIKIPTGILLSVVALLSSWTVLFPLHYQYFPDTFYSTNQDSTTVKNEYMPIWVQKATLPYTSERFNIFSGKGEILSQSFTGSAIIAHVIIQQPSIIQLNLIYFPGWKVRVDGRSVPIVYTNTNGLMRFPVTSGGHTIAAQFQETVFRGISDGISLVSLLIVVAVFLLRKKYGK